jgi:hypothetical protein
MGKPFACEAGSCEGQPTEEIPSAPANGPKPFACKAGSYKGHNA